MEIAAQQGGTGDECSQGQSKLFETGAAEDSAGTMKRAELQAINTATRRADQVLAQLLMVADHFDRHEPDIAPAVHMAAEAQQELRQALSALEQCRQARRPQAQRKM